MSNITPPRPLEADDSVNEFDCGKAPLNEFLQLHAYGRQKAKLSRTYVVTDGSRVIGFYTLAHVVISPESTPKKMGHGMPRSIPAILMARFAVDLKFQGQGMGRSLFIDALSRVWSVMINGPAPVRLFVVDAKDDEARKFYEGYDMVPSPQDPMRLFLSHKSIQNLFE